MNSFLYQQKNDFSMSFRDPAFTMIMLAPFLLLGIIRFGIPPLLQWYPDGAEYTQAVIGFFALLTGVFPAFIMSFRLLDEKDQQLIPVIRVSPMGYKKYLLGRLFYVGILSALFSLTLMLANGIYHFTTFALWLSPLFIALNGIWLMLLTVTISRNKVEGATVLTTMNFMLILPILTLFLNNPLEWLMGLLPPFWFYQFLDLGKPIILIIGIMVLLCLNAWLMKVIMKKIL